MSMSSAFNSANLELDFPQSIGVYEHYEEAQKAVDYLADNEFPVQNLLICGTELKLIERVTGRKTWPRVIGRSALGGLTTGLLFGMLVLLLGLPWYWGLAALAAAVVFNVIFGGLAYSVSGGRRDFTSTTVTVPTKFEVLCEHKVAAEAKQKLAEMPGGRAKLFE
ncbi:general stress protein [Granulicoccus phenolivorans]|uniref:general stress protein n=1 Tax=Granulicoccus phenolivorans TaxID=266854 RepID=UPI0003F86635|nr:general stress protein [Granulicoccus phenolivorans]